MTAGQFEMQATGNDVFASEPLARINSAVELAAARDAAGITVQQIADRLRFSVSKVNALEAGNWDHLPSRAFARAALRSVARLIGVDATPLIESVGGYGQADALRMGIRPQVAVPVATASMLGVGAHRARQPGGARRWLTPAGIGALVVVGSLLLWTSQQSGVGGGTDSRVVQVPIPGAGQTVVASSRPDASSVTGARLASLLPVGNMRPAIRSTSASAGDSAASQVTAPGGSGPITAVPVALTSTTRPASDGAVAAIAAKARPVQSAAQPAAEPLTFPIKMPASEVVELRFSRDSWVDIRHKDGEKLLFGLQKRNKSVVLNGVPPMKVVIGNPDGVKMRFRGETVDLKAKTRKGVSRLVLN